MDIQKYALYTTRISFEELKETNIRGVTAQWKQNENTLCITVYYDRDLSEKDQEDASDACTEIIASFSDALMEENYIRWDYPRPLPDQEFLAYSRNERKL